MPDRSSSIHGIHYEVSGPVKNRSDGYFYQRVRQVDGNGNLVGIGEQIHRSTNPGSEDGLFARPIDLAKLGSVAMGAGQTLIGGLVGDLRTAAIGATKFARDASGGVTDGYKSWPGTHKPWEPLLDWRTGTAGVDFVEDGAPDQVGDGRSIGNWWERPQATLPNQPRERRWDSIPTPDFVPSPLPNARGWRDDLVRDSAAAAGFPSRYNVFEHGYPEPISMPSPSSETPSVRKLSTWHVRPDGASPAGSLAENGVLPSRIFGTDAAPISYPAVSPQHAPRGLPALLAEIGAFDSLEREAPPSGGLPGLIQEYPRNR